MLENNPDCIRSRNENKDAILFDFTENLVRSGSLQLLDSQNIAKNPLLFNLIISYISFVFVFESLTSLQQRFEHTSEYQPLLWYLDHLANRPRVFDIFEQILKLVNLPNHLLGHRLDFKYIFACRSQKREFGEPSTTTRSL